MMVRLTCRSAMLGIQDTHTYTHFLPLWSKISWVGSLSFSIVHGLCILYSWLVQTHSHNYSLKTPFLSDPCLVMTVVLLFFLPHRMQVHGRSRWCLEWIDVRLSVRRNTQTWFIYYVILSHYLMYIFTTFPTMHFSTLNEWTQKITIYTSSSII